MFRLLRTLTSIAVFLGGWCALQPAPAVEGLPIASAAAVGSSTSVPWGWADFCERYAGECDAGPGAPANLHLDARALADLNKVDRWVNAHIEPTTDMDHWGVVDRWDLPIDGKGDCEDYALLKRKMLIDLGYPRQAVLMTVVHDGSDQGHAILTVKTDRGDYVLDNLNDVVKPWTATGYRFVKRQSQEDPNVWVAVEPPALAIAGNRAAL